MLANRVNLTNLPWLVLKFLKSNSAFGYKLSKGDIVKVGRIKFMIREIKMQNRDYSEHKTKNMEQELEERSVKNCKSVEAEDALLQRVNSKYTQNKDDIVLKAHQTKKK